MITKRLVKEVSEDVVKVVVDYFTAPKSKRADIDTGGFQLIHKGRNYAQIPKTFGLTLVCERKRIKL